MSQTNKPRCGICFNSLTTWDERCSECEFDEKNAALGQLIVKTSSNSVAKKEPEGSNSRVCELCLDEKLPGGTPVAVQRCIDCEQDLCADCCAQHRKTKATKTHRLEVISRKPFCDACFDESDSLLEETPLASKRCEQCDHNLCDKCCKVHGKIKRTKMHTLIQLLEKVDNSLTVRDITEDRLVPKKAIKERKAHKPMFSKLALLDREQHGESLTEIKETNNPTMSNQITKYSKSTSMLKFPARCSMNLIRSELIGESETRCPKRSDLERRQFVSFSSNSKRRSVLESVGPSFTSQLENKLSNNAPSKLSPTSPTGKEPTQQPNLSEFQQTILAHLNMAAFHSHKLSYAEVVKLRGSGSSKGFSVIEKLMMSDSRAPYVALSPLDKNILVEPDTTIKKTVDNIPKRKKNNRINIRNNEINEYHPMDIMNAVFNCCDNIVLQTLMEKLYLCRLSIPFLLPDPQICKSTFLLWSLRGIVPTWKTESNEIREMLMVDIPQMIISIMRIGRLYVSKSKVLNDLLNSTHHDTFFHRDCDHGMSSRIGSRGTVEAAWYLPREGDNTSFKKMFTILNLRGDATNHQKEAQWLCSFSGLIFLMINLNSGLDTNTRQILESKEFVKANIVLCYIARTMDEMEQYSDELDEFQTYLSEREVKICDSICNWNEERLLSFGEWKHRMRVILQKYIHSMEAEKTICDLRNTAKDYGFLVDEGDPLCQKAYLAVKQLTEAFQSSEPTKLKLELLPLHGKLWKSFGNLVKDQNRNKPLDNELDKFIATKQTQLDTIRNKQYECLENNKSTFALDVLSHISQEHNYLEKQYFLIWLQMILNEGSRRTMPPLQTRYYAKLKEIRQKWNSMDETNKSSLKAELDDLDEKLQNASFGVEHIFREFGQMYEATENYKILQTIKKKFHCISNLPSIVASLVLHGFPFELMDGDAAFVPTIWVKAVFEEMSKFTKNKKIFVISVVGIQSSGKSTLLNTMFGSKFAVSAGRCTRGLYCLMVPVDKQTLAVNYDHILIIDTEGLRAPELQELSKHHDNELATLVIGLGDVTIVNIKGENVADINDVLQIVIHAMIRINIANPKLVKPSCIFVHQNVSAVDAAEMLKTEQEKLLSKLDKITSGAAEEESITNIKQFKDVITYDEDNYSFFMPDLWQGQPPMASVDWEYCAKACKIKTFLTQHSLMVSESNLLTVARFSSRISDLWKAILLQDFVFSFKNTQEIKAYNHLDEKFTRLHWDLRETSLKVQIDCTKAVIDLVEKEKLEHKKQFLENKITTDLSEKCDLLQTELKSYFETHENKDILVQWSARYKKNLDNFCLDEIHRLKSAMRENIKRKIAQMNTTDKASLFCRENITKEAMLAAVELRAEKRKLSENELQNHFENKWLDWLRKFSSTKVQVDPKNLIISAIKGELAALFNNEKQLLHKQLKNCTIDDLMEFDFYIFSFNVNEEHLSVAGGGVKIWWGNYAILHKVTDKCIEVLHEIKAYVSGCYDSDFDNAQVTHVLKTVKTFINTFDKNIDGFTLTKEFYMLFAINVCRCAATEFIRNKEHFQEVSDPLAEVKKRKPDFLKLYENSYYNIEKENTAADWFSAEITEWLRKTIFMSFGPVILNAVSVDESSYFDTKQKFLNTIFIEIAEKNRFQDFADYLRDQVCFYKRKIKQYIDEILQKCDILCGKTRLQMLIETECKTYASKITNSLRQLLLDKPYRDSKDYVAKLKKRFEINPTDSRDECSGIFPMSRLDTLERMEITEFERFTLLIIAKLPSVVEKCEQDLSNKTRRFSEFYPGLEFFPESNPIEVLSEKVLGCPARCPFCKMPCKYTYKDHFKEDDQMQDDSVLHNQSCYHNAHQHCPQGVSGYYWRSTNKLLTLNCQAAVASDAKFKNEDTADAYVKYKEYTTCYPSWEIAPDRGMESSLYWKWFMCKYRDDLVNHFKADSIDIPDEWKAISWDDAKKSLLTDY